MKTRKMFVIGIFAVILTLTFAACDEDNDFTCTHDWGNWFGENMPTCTEPSSGTITRDCKNAGCNETQENEDILPALEHDMQPTENIQKHPTCTEEGLGELACARDGCNHTEEGEVIEPLEHLVKNWEIVTTPFINGKEIRICQRNDCNEAEERDAPSTEGLTFTLINNNTAYSVSTDRVTPLNATVVIIPAEHNGLPVTQIANDAFSGSPRITGIFIPEGIMSIGNNAFRNCTVLTGVILPESVTVIGGAFSRCTNLTITCNSNFITENGVLYNKEKTLLISAYNVSETFVVPNSVTSIGDYAFSYCRGLTSITLPDSLTSIGDRAFYDCNGLTSITLPDSVTSIGDYAFWGCTGLTSITLPNSLTSIGAYAFSYCTGLTNIILPDSVTRIDTAAFQNCTGLTSIIIPESVPYIGNGLLRGCTSLTSITLRRAYNLLSIMSWELGDFATVQSGAGTYTTTNPGNNATWTKVE